MDPVTTEAAFFSAYDYCLVELVTKKALLIAVSRRCERHYC